MEPVSSAEEGLTVRRVMRAVAAGLVCLTIAAAPLAAGGMRAEVKLLLAVPALTALLLVALDRILGPRDERGLALPLVLWPPLLVVGLIALQLVPIPWNLLAFLSPEAAALRGDLGPPGPAPVSLDPPATAVGLALQAAFAAVLVVAFTLRRSRQAWILRTLAATGALVALIGLAHWATGATTLYGLYPLRHIDRLTGFFGTFVNNNTLAGFEVLAGLMALGLLARSDDARARALALAAFVLCCTAALLAGSRGGHAALALGIVAFAVFAQLGRGSEAWRVRARLASYGALGLVGLGVAGALLVLPDWSAATLAHLEDDPKVAGWPAALEMAKAYWITGSGRDSFIFAFPAWQALPLPGTVSHPENHLLQLACELGLPGLLLGIGGAVWAVATLVPGISRRGSPTDWGLAAGLLGCGLQQLVDFGLESAGLALPVAAALGVALARAARRQALRSPARRLAPPILGGLAAVGLGLLAWRGPALLDRQADVALARDPAAALADHPADPFAPLAIARQRLQSGAPLGEVLPWINRALARFPQSHQPHLLAARALRSAHRPAQAAVEYRLAVERAPWLDTALAAEAVAGLTAPRHLLAALPDSPRGRTLLVHALVAAGRHRELRETMEELELLAPDDPERRRALGEACLALEDLPCTEAQATWLITHDHPALGWPLRARLAARQGDAAGARTALETMGPLADRSAEALLLTARVQTTLGDLGAALGALDLLERRVASDPARRAEVHILRARIFVRQARGEEALDHFVRALALRPDPRTAAAAVRHARSIGRLAEANRMLDTARRQWPRHPTLEALAIPNR